MPKPIGRPKLEIDWRLFEELCKIHCTLEEITHILQVSMDALERHVKKNYRVSFKEKYAELASNGKMSLRRSQWAAAITDKSEKMMIWLGKQHLGQADKHEALIEDKRELAGLPMEEVDAIIESSSECN